MRFFKTSKLRLLAVAVSWVCFHSAIALAEDEQGTPTPADTETKPAQENPAFFPDQTQSPPPSSTPAPAATESREKPPTDDLGTGKFSTSPFRLSASVLAGYDDNVITTSAQGKPSVFVNPSAEINYQFGDPRTTATLRTGGGISYYFDRPGDQGYDVNAFLGLSAIHKATGRLTLNLVAYLTYQTEPDFSANVGTNRRSGNFLYSSNKFTALYQWLPRFSTSTSYNLVTVKYDDSSFGLFLDRFEHTFGNEFRFLLWPTTTLVGEYRFQVVSYDQAPIDSTTHLLLAGLDHNFSPRFGFTFRGGGELRSFQDGHEEKDPYFESTLNYAAGRKTTLSWTNRYSLEEPGVAGPQSRTTFRTGLLAKYGFTQRISSSIGFYFVHDDYAAVAPTFINPFGAPSFTEDSVDLTLGIRYDINRTFAIDAGYGHTEITSELPGRAYSRNRYFGGVHFTF